MKALLFAVVFTIGGFSQGVDTAYVPVRVNVNAAVSILPDFDVCLSIGCPRGEQTNVMANTETTLTLLIPRSTSVSYIAQRQADVPAAVRHSRGKFLLELNRQQFGNAEVSLFSVSGKRIMQSKASASKSGEINISRPNIAQGVYLLSVKGVNGSSFTNKLTHRGGALNINVAFGGEDVSMRKQVNSVPSDAWTITAVATGYNTVSYSFTPVKGTNPVQNITLSQPLAAKNFTETVNNVSFDMIYVPGGTFTIGCESSSGCPANTSPVSGVTVSSYFIGKAEVTTNLWHAVMGGSASWGGSNAYTNMTWYDAMEFACKLSRMTGRNYRMVTEAEWEYAAKNHLSSLEGIGNSNEEWAYNTWNASHSGGIDPIGPGGAIHNQKTRRDAQGVGDNITGRLIRSIEGIGPALRLVISAEMDFPPGMVPACDIHAPTLDGEPVNSYRDPRWVTGSDARWTSSGDIAIGSFDLRIWEDGAARLRGYNDRFQIADIDGQWFTSNNIALVFVPNSGSVRKYAYIFLDETQGSLISDGGFVNGYIGRIVKEAASNVAKPTISNLKSGAELAAAAGNDYKMVDMVNIPQSVRQQDSRLLDGANQGWFQHNQGSAHHYRKDVDVDEFRFTVNQGSSRTMLANGNWFTVNNTFLRVTHSDGYTVDYLYAVTSDGTFYHNSFMGYERGDFRMFTKTDNNSSTLNNACGSICTGEIPKGQASSIYNNSYFEEIGQSTFVPAPCPTGGCQ
jgi:hypothetical protein